jgi:tetratricopeptide (TPR) repeat protein
VVIYFYLYWFKRNALKIKITLVFVTFGLFLFSFCATAQKERKKKSEPVYSSARIAEAERIFTEGEKFYILEDYSKALFYFQQVLEYSPANPTVYYKIADIYLKGSKEEDLIQAAQNIENALRLERKNKYFYLLAAQIYSAQRQFNKASQVLETMMKEIGGTEEHLYELASTYLQENKLDDALNTYNQAEAVMGITELSSLQKQRIYLVKGKLNEAISEGEKLIHAYPDEERYVMGLAETLAQHGKATLGITYLEKFIADHPDAGNTKMLLAALYRESGQEQKSRQYVMSIFDDPQVEVSSKVLMIGTYNAALSQNKSKKINDPDLEVFVLELFKKLEISYPRDADVHLVGGDLYLMLEKNEEARNEYSQAVRYGANSLEAWQNLLFIETQAGLSDSVITHSEQGLEFFPNQGMIYYFNGVAHLRKKNYNEAIQTLEQSRKLSTNNPNLLGEINSMLGDAYNAIKENEKSDKAYENALALNPTNEYVLNNYSYFLALRKVNLDKAEKMSSVLVKNHPDNTAYLDTYAWVLYQEGKYKEAKKFMEKIFSIGKVSAVHYEHYGDILYQLGDIDEAVEQWQKAKSLNGNSEVLNKKITNRKIY